VENNIQHLKEIHNHDNPLFQLMYIDKQQKGQNKLVKKLIDGTASVIAITDQEIIEHTFQRPSQQTITYAILFDSSLNSLFIHKQIIGRLLAQLKKWEEGICGIDVNTWKNFSVEQASIIHQIWTLVSRSAAKQYQLDTLFNQTDQDMKEKLEINQKVMTCIDAYCQQANDSNTYRELGQKMREQLNEGYVRSVEIAPTLKAIIPFAKQLNPYANTKSWREFLSQKMTGKGKIQEMY
jgi:hypothetical protein